MSHTDDHYSRNTGQKRSLKAIMCRVVLPIVVVAGVGVAGYFWFTSGDRMFQADIIEPVDQVDKVQEEI
jgi:hypothetical protein